MQQSTRSRKIKAVLASGAVLGIGAAVTLAAWTDDEAATATFNTGVFALQSTTDGDTWDSHDEAVSLSFDGASLTPNTSTTAFFGVQLSEATSVDATLDMATEGTALDGVTYDLYQVQSAAECADAPVEGTELLTDSALDAGTLTDVALGADEPLLLCYVVSAGENPVQDSNASVTWTFSATSN